MALRHVPWLDALHPHGDSLTQKYEGDLFTFSNIDAPDSVRLFDLWYEHMLWDDRLSLRLGQLAADEEFAGTDYGSSFIDGTCGWPAIIAANVPSPAFPAATPGVRLAVDLGSGWSFKTAVYNGDPCPVDDSGEPTNEHGVEIAIRDAFVMGEAMSEWQVGKSRAPLPGRAKLGGWYHTGEFGVARVDCFGQSLANPASSGEPRSVRGNWGLYLAAEQQFTQEDDSEPSGQGLGWFSRFGVSPADRNLLEGYAEGGFTYTGLLPGRDDDAFGVAAVYGQLSGDLRRLAEESNRQQGSEAPLPDYEMAIECTYRAVLGLGIVVQPVFAYLLHPGGSSALENAVVVGIRATLDF